MDAHGSAASRLGMAEGLMRAALDAVASPLALVDSAGRIAHANPAWAELAARGAPFGDLGSLVAPPDREGSAYLRRLADLAGPLSPAAHKLARALQDALDGRKPGPIAYRARRPDGEAPCEAQAWPVAPSAGRWALVGHTDLSERERAAASESAALEAALASERVRSHLRRVERRLAAASQDLHTPITPVRLELHLLSSGALGPLSEAQARALAIIERNVQRWADSERRFPELGAVPPGAAESFDLAAVARDATDGVQTQALQQGIHVLPPSAGLSLPVRAPADVARDAIDVYLEHALRASPAGATIAVEACAHGDEALVEVRDSGPGLTPRELRGLFEPWGGRHVGDPAGVRLHHVRLEVERAGGRAWAESDGPSLGTLLGVAFPLEEKAVRRAPGS